MADFVISVPDDAVEVIASAFTDIFSAEWTALLSQYDATPSTPSHPPNPVEFARQKVIQYIQVIVQQYQTKPAPPPPPINII